MDIQKKFLSDKHNRLLEIAIWAKYLAWIALTIYILLIGMQIIQLATAQDNGNFFGPTSQSFLTLMRTNPFALVTQLVSIVSVLLKGIIYFFVLKGISLGLNMIVETDINYREKVDSRNEK